MQDDKEVEEKYMNVIKTHGKEDISTRKNYKEEKEHDSSIISKNRRNKVLKGCICKESRNNEINQEEWIKSQKV